MNRREASRALAAIPLAVAAELLTAPRAVARALPQGDYPRIRAAITSIEDAVDFMEKAPDTFGGHKAAAIAACRAAVRQLNLAIAANRQRRR
jgi:hypothetical protein